MEAIREIVKSADPSYSIQLPGWAVGREVELIILPVNRDNRAGEKGNKRFIGLFDKPVKVEKYLNIDRDALHAR